MRAFKTRRKWSGVSIVELLVSSGLVLLVLGEIWFLLQAGGRFYLRARGQSEVQRNALFALRWLTKEVTEGNPVSFRHYETESESGEAEEAGEAGEIEGLVFASPKDNDGQVRYDSKGRIQWASIVAYYIEPESKILYRTSIELDELTSKVPQIDDETHHVNILSALPNRRVIARGIIDLTTEQGPRNVLLEIHSRDEEAGAGLKVRTRLEMKN